MGHPGGASSGIIKATATADFSTTAAESAAFGRNDGVCGVGERNGNSNNKGKGVLGWLIVCDPTHRKGAMDGAPGRRFIGMIKATATAEFSSPWAQCASLRTNETACGV